MSSTNPGNGQEGMLVKSLAGDGVDHGGPSGHDPGGEGTSVKSFGAPDYMNGEEPSLALVEAIAQRVVELLRDDTAAGTPSTPRMVDAAEMARVLNVSRDTVYRHADELGAVRPFGEASRLRFDVERAITAWTARSAGAQSLEPEAPAASASRGGRPRGRAGTTGDLLPIRGQVAA